jgi:hypothetical protein
MTESKSSKDEKTNHKWGRIATGAFAPFIFYIVYEKAELSGLPDTQTIRLIFASVASGLIILANFFVELLLEAWQRILSYLLIFFGKYPSFRFWFVFPVIVISILYPIQNLQSWEYEATLGILLFIYLVFFLPAALISLLKDDRQFEKTKLAKIIPRNLLSQNPQAAIEFAFTALEDHLRKRIPNGEKYYSNGLIGKAFEGKKSELVYFVDGREKTEALFRLISGTYSLFRNPRHHKIVEDDAYFAHNLVSFIGTIMNFIDESEERKEVG